MLSLLNPFLPFEKKKIRTPWGNLKPKVDLFPLLYLLFIYGFVYLIPYGRNFIGISWFDWFRSEDGPLEWLQFFFYFFSFIFASLVSWNKRNTPIKINLVLWIGLALLCLFVAGEEISWGERLTGHGFEFLRNINRQGESNIHNINFFHNILLDPSFEISCLLFGWFGWKNFPRLDVFPAKQYSLYFLFVALFFLYFDLSYSSTVKRIPNDQEIFELLMALGLMLHSMNIALPYLRNYKKKKNDSF